MNKYTTIIKAMCPKDNTLKTYFGPYVPGISFKDAQDFCERNGLGYCKVDGLLISEIDEETGSKISYENNN